MLTAEAIIPALYIYVGGATIILNNINMKTTPIPNNLRKYRKSCRLSQIQVARLLGLKDRSRISRWECGECYPQVETLLRLAAIYHTMVDAFYIDTLREMRKKMGNKRSSTT